MNYQTLELQVIEWATARQIIPNASPEVQMLKVASEVGELADALIKGQKIEMSLEFGDILVTLIILAEMLEISPEICLELAYDKIKNRTGTMMPNGVFVKDSI